MAFEMCRTYFTAVADRRHDGRNRVVRVQPAQVSDCLRNAREQEERDYRRGDERTFIRDTKH